LAEDVFLKPFMDALGRAVSGLKPFKGWFSGVYRSYWHEFGGVGRAPESFAVADGSCSSTTFRGGLKAVCARAIVNVYRAGSLVESFPSVDVRFGWRLRRGTLYMRALELNGLARALRGCEAALCDGDLYPTLHPVIVRHRRQEVEAYVEYLNALHNLYAEAYDRRILLLGVVKDSLTNYVRARILAQRISAEKPELAKALSRVRSLRNMARLLSEAGAAYVEEAEALTSDEEVFDECAPEPGFTAPMLLAPQPIFLSEEVKAGTACWWDSRIRRRLIDKGPPLSEVAGALDRLYRLPPVVMFYWRPWHGIGVYRVDVAGWAFGRGDRWGDLGGDAFIDEGAAEGVAAMLNALSPEPFAVKPLFDADDAVRFSSGLYRECYLPLIVEALRGAGFKAVMTKRDLRELIR